MVIDPIQAIRDDAVPVHQDLESFEGYGFAGGGNNCTLLDADRGDVDQAFKDADHTFEETYQSQPINQGFLEPMACVADVEPNGRLTVWASTQGPYQVRAQLASVLDIPVSRIKVIAMELGGGFGAKLRLALEAFPAMLAMKSGRPVKLINTREEAFTLNGPRLETNIRLKTGVMNDGRIVAREAYSIFDVGTLLEILKNEKNTLSDLKKIIKHVVFDEYQDVNKLQDELLEQLSKGSTSVCVVGDDDQNIFQWQDGRSGERYYTARVTVDRRRLHEIAPEIELSPGMPAEVFIETGERTMLEYLMQPFLQSVERAFREK